MNTVISYNLRLSQNHHWSLIGFDGTHQWLQKLSTILMLKQSHQYYKNRIYYFQNKVEDSSLENILIKIQKTMDEQPPMDGWYNINLRKLTLWHHPFHNSTICILHENQNKILEYSQMYSSLRPVYETIITQGGFPLHGAFAVKENMGVILAAPSGTGKSTCSKRFPHPWNSLCDDEIVLVKQNVGFVGHPFPTWSNFITGQSNNPFNIQKKAPISSVFFLEQGSRDEFNPVSTAEAAVRLCEASLQICKSRVRCYDIDKKKKLNQQIFSNAYIMAKTLPCFVLRATLDGCFWEHIEKVLSKNNYLCIQDKYKS